MDAYIGKRVSIVTREHMVYEGLIQKIDVQNSEITLNNVTRRGAPMGTDEYYKVMVLRGNDIQDLNVDVQVGGNDIQDLNVDVQVGGNDIQDLRVDVTRRDFECNVGDFISLITRDDYRVEGTVSHVHDSIIIITKGTCYGTERRRRRNRVGCGEINTPVMFYCKDIKETEIVAGKEEPKIDG